MNSLLIAVAAILTAAAGALLLAAFATIAQMRSVYLKRKSRQTIVVHLKSGTSIKGVLQAVYLDVIVLTHADAAPLGAGRFSEVDGEQTIPRANVDFLQIVEPEEAS